MTTVSTVPKRAWVEQIMGMPISIHVRGDLADAGDAVESTFEGLRGVDALFSTYKSESQISQIRRGELTIEDADQQVRDVAALCRRAGEVTDGWFDAWLPWPETPDGARLFEPTGLVKGWAVQRACAELASALPQADVLVNAGGDIAVFSNRDDTPDWRLGVESPLTPGTVIGEISLRHGGLATSGTAARGTHILSPRTGAPVAELASVSIAGPSLMWVDVFATAAFAMGPAAAASWLPTCDAYTWMTIAPTGELTNGTGALAHP